MPCSQREKWFVKFINYFFMHQFSILFSIQFSYYDVTIVNQNLFLSGTDTGAITTVWALAGLAKNPRLMKKAQAEVKKCIGNKEKSQKLIQISSNTSRWY